jgi:UDPglucose--hexose-1-phosphate uridylyltransferase
VGVHEAPGDAAGSSTGYGSHEVVVETPDHGVTIATLPADSVHLTLVVWRERLRALRMDQRLAHVQIFKNVGRAAGATRQHPHSQILAVSILPRAVATELEALAEHRRRTSRCLACETVERELAAGHRVVLTAEGYTAFCPFASRLPFETRIVPTAHRPDYAGSSDEELLSLARVLKQTVGALARVLEHPSFNLVLHTAPMAARASKDGDVEFHWRLELLPRLGSLAGFEWGTGMYINHLPPEEAALQLRAGL